MNSHTDDHDRFEQRSVEVTDPQLSASTREKLTEEAREAVGADTVRVPADRSRPSAGDRPHDAGPFLNLTGARLMIVVIGLMFIMVGVIGLVLSGSGWWAVPIAVGILIGAALWVVRIVLGMTALSDHASPAATAAMEADGIRNPDEFISAIVDEFTEPVDEAAAEHRTVEPAEDPARATAEQKSATTPTSGRSRAVGPE